MNDLSLMTPDLALHRAAVRARHVAPEAEVLSALADPAPMTPELRQAATLRAATLVDRMRGGSRPGLMEVFLAEYGLSTEEGIALMCLAEALLRVPDAETVDDLIEDKIAPSDWGTHLGRSSSSLVNASTWALMLTGRVLRDGRQQGVARTLRGAVKRLGEPVIRTAVRRAMREMGNQFVLGEDIGAAMSRAEAQEARGYAYSYDMLGEAALTAADARAFFLSYSEAIAAIARASGSGDVADNPGISIKLSALHPRYEEAQRERVMAELVPRVRELARAARAANMGLSIDAEEADRLEISLDVIEAVARDPELAGWDGFGVVIQAYSRRAAPVIDWVHALAESLGRRFMVRLVKGAYWDTEIKRAQVEGLPDFPVFTRKAATDVSYISCARRLLGMTPRIYPQFATHNAHTVAAILEMAGDDRRSFEFQRLHGMGEALHDMVKADEGTRCRIYAPVGAHRDLLAYLVRRLLENGANSSFVNQVLDGSVPSRTVAADPFEAEGLGRAHPAVKAPADLYAPERTNSRGWDLHDPVTLEALETARAPFRDTRWTAGPVLAIEPGQGASEAVRNPADPEDLVGQVTQTAPEDVARAARAARPWDADAAARAAALTRAADLYEAHAPELFAIVAREAGKTPKDAVAEVREAVDFLRYYAARATEVADPPQGVFTCISPWNFPLAIFTGQIVAALAAGNAVLAKPAEATPLVAARAVALLHEAGVPLAALQFLPGTGSGIGRALTSDPAVAGVAFTGSTGTAQAIHRAMADTLDPGAPLIAETGGINAMIVDSTALPEQAVRDIVASAFQSAGQRCSALRILYLQEDIAPAFLRMLFGAMDELRLGDPWDHATDVGPVIDAAARDGIRAHVEAARAEGRVMHELPAPAQGHFVAPVVLRVSGMAEMEREVFGPVLHVATYRADRTLAVVDAVNAAGYGLTFGLHTRIDTRVEEVRAAIRAGNVYVNRNQIGAVVGSQPFGGCGLSGTGPKAGGPLYVPRFCKPRQGRGEAAEGAPLSAADLTRRIAALPPVDAASEPVSLPGPTGESNRYSTVPRSVVLCLGPGRSAALDQARQARAVGCSALAVAPGLSGDEGLDGTLDPAALRDLGGIEAVAWWGGTPGAQDLRRALAGRDGPILPLITAADLAPFCVTERHLCIDTTASGGNASLLARAG
ncbi:bifunctional proline dehydrogenase/L-glutamate gamma-semialdehyde dehydrogenase PutA [Roseibacterium sp. SDUM158017]|uniref:bifunctional proline dehydrogenase/L-glutamate gamma-semialdehyde dehydrogenase PutA n=1 Tax=Roseicyclus salinarum TaxID=3036773 RepID=UPI0024155229|nr:bifunctional proline dehydrogenase/L-glutamate gamma-semialdehyde dehydrogenase PutA [Roseibacterium sp. SDUM158017]MDG4648514.1 bifunctional proline dehydrogenase/L-glutamate gamma-semialdehyde dehydrogenase PutA [Roseibacterium sp. SDUM158017]